MNRNKFLIDGKITVNRRLVDEHYLMTVIISDSFPKPLPGQFIMVRLKGRHEPFLSRPFSIYQYNQHDDKVFVQILYRVAGKGTRILSELKRGAILEISGPHGHPFDILPHASNVILIAGGVGVAPISYLASHYKDTIRNNTDIKLTCYLGAKSAKHLLGVETLKMSCSSVEISTDDGSSGYHGMVTESFARTVAAYRSDQSLIFACGPASMLKRISEILLDYPIPCQVLLEQRMACGFGACLGCTVEVRGAGEMKQYVRVCTEGPVFNIHDVIWE
jgi:dihydroorotate dehydrogenase electron transfer subunit